MSTIRAIGFANVFYTLWEIETTPNYISNNGVNYHVNDTTHYRYIKNISFSLDKVNSLYPDLEFMSELKGITTSFIKTDDKTNLCPFIMCFGKYYGENIDDLIVKDFEYVLWLCNNHQNSPNGEYALSTDFMVRYFYNLNDILLTEKLNQQHKSYQINQLESIEILFEKNLKLGDGYAYHTKEIDGVNVVFIFTSYKVMSYSGFEYALPMKYNSGKKIKNKNVKINWNSDNTTFNEYGLEIIVVDFEILK